MPDKVVSVEFRFGGLDKAANDLDRIASRAREVDRTAGGRNRISDAFDPSPGGRTPDAFGDGGGGSGFGWSGGKYQNPLAGTGFSRIAMPLFMIHAASQVFEGFGKGLEEISQKSMSTERAFETLAGKMAESIPLIGGLAKGMESLVDTVSGAASRRAAIHEFTAASDRQFGFAGFSNAARLSRDEAIFQARRTAGDRNADLDAATQLRESLTPDALASFRPLGPLGEIQSGVGQAQLRSHIASAAASAAESTSRRRQADADAATAGLGPLRDRQSSLYQESAAASEWASRLNAARQRSGGFFGYLLGERAVTPSEVRESQSQANTQSGLLAGVNAQVGGQLGVVAERIKDAEKAATDAAKARLDAKRAELDVDRARLAVQERDIDRVRSGSIQAGFRSPAENQADLELARLARQNPQALTPENWARLSGNPILSQFAQQQGLGLAEQDPAVQQMTREFGGLGGQTLQEAQRNQEQAMDRIVTEMAEAGIENGQRMADAVNDSLEKLVDTFLKLFDAKVNQKANELNQQTLKQQMQAK